AGQERSKHAKYLLNRVFIDVFGLVERVEGEPGALAPGGRPPRASTSGVHLGRPPRASTSGVHLGRPPRASTSGRPPRASTSGSPLGGLRPRARLCCLGPFAFWVVSDGSAGGPPGYSARSSVPAERAVGREHVRTDIRRSRLPPPVA